MTTPNPLTYVSTPAPEGCHFKISPSSFADFISYPHRWYRQQVLGEDKFTYNTSSVIGTVVHYCAEQVAKKQEVDTDVINEYINSFKPTEDFDPLTVRDQWQLMAETLVNDYVLKAKYLAVEKQTGAEIKDGYAVAGTLDALEGTKEDCLLNDYKTYSSKTAPRAIPANYKYQLLVYAWLLRKEGYNVTRIRLTYVNRNIVGEISQKTGKQLKSYPPEVTVLTQTITEEDFDFIESQLDLCVDALEAAKQHPELLHVIFHDPRLKA